MRDSRVLNARCCSAESLKRSVRRAVKIAVLEFGIPGDFPVSGVDCLSVRKSFEEVTASLLSKARCSVRSRHRLTTMMGSCKRLFDAPCKRCDAVSAAKAKSIWANHACERVPDSQSKSAQVWADLWLKSRVRALISGWGKRLERSRVGGIGGEGVYVPDSQGCYEVAQRSGGTLACDPGSYSDSYSRVRLGVAKTKGKHRVVTMQSARVKRVLKPLHNALYDHISSFDWCVRGDVTKDDFLAVREGLEKDEFVISGDYSNATNEIYLPAVEAIVSVIAEDPHLTDEEREVLLGSFENIEFKYSVCKSDRDFHPVNRGSMMGNLLSFPILCLLNRACYEVCVDVLHPGERSVRKGRFNGDDCMFRGNQVFYDTWEYVTGLFGLVVNREKTGCSRSWATFNSTHFDYKRGSRVARPVLSFLRLNRDEPGSILRLVLEGISSLRISVQLWIVNCLMRHEISLRGVSEDLGYLTPFWRSVLLKRRWFRTALARGGAKIDKTGTDRCGQTVVGPVPVEAAFSFVTRCHDVLEKERVEYWTGRKVRAVREVLDRRDFAQRCKERQPPARGRIVFGPVEWKFLWPKELLEFFQDNFPHCLYGRRTGVWMEDHPLLTTRVSYTVETTGPTFYPPPRVLLRGSTVPSGGVRV
nr:putative RNA-dependent RNA polymerase [Ustilaginoidea virens botourmiavirus 7]